MGAPSFDDVFAVMAVASVGDLTARVHVPDDADSDDSATRIALALNVLLGDMAARVDAAPTARRRRSVRRRPSIASCSTRARWPKWLIDAKTLRYLAVNEAATRAYGYSREEFLAMTAEDLRPPQDVPGVAPKLAFMQPGGCVALAGTA